MIIGISGKLGSGKDTVGNIIKLLNVDEKEFTPTTENIVADLKVNSYYASICNSTCQIKKFRDKLKEIVCFIIGCTRVQLEDKEFKKKELGKEWWKYKITIEDHNGVQVEYKPYLKHKELESEEHWINLDIKEYHIEVIKLTPEKLLQLLETECGKEIIHPDIWVNALFAGYKSDMEQEYGKIANYYPDDVKKYPNWVITDVKSLNQAKAIKDRGGIVIRVNRKMTSEEWQKLYPEVIVLDPDGWNRDERYQYEWFEEKITLEEYKLRVMRSTCKFKVKFEDYFKEHLSETALDDYEFDYTIDNNGSIEELVEKVKQLKLIS